MSIDIGQNRNRTEPWFQLCPDNDLYYCSTGIYIQLLEMSLLLLKETAVWLYRSYGSYRAGDSVKTATYNPYFPLISLPLFIFWLW